MDGHVDEVLLGLDIERTYWNASGSRYHHPETMEVICTPGSPHYSFKSELISEELLDLLRPDVYISGHFYWEYTIQSRQRDQSWAIMNSSNRPKEWIHLLQPVSNGFINSGKQATQATIAERNILNEEHYAKNGSDGSRAPVEAA
eukprot:gene19155-25763_t